MPPAPQVFCPECGEHAATRPPTSWTPVWGPRPAFSHLDGEPLCPVLTADGYRPARPVLLDGTPIDTTSLERTP